MEIKKGCRLKRGSIKRINLMEINKGCRLKRGCIEDKLDGDK
jgi:hypothetical protein